MRLWIRDVCVHPNNLVQVLRPILKDSVRLKNNILTCWPLDHPRLGCRLFVLLSDLSVIFPRCHHLLQVYICKAYCCCLRLVAFLRGHYPSEVSVWKKVYCLEPVLFLDLSMIAVMVSLASGGQLSVASGAEPSAHVAVVCCCCDGMSMVVAVEHLKMVM